jgi:hypothetical protein
MSGKINGKAQPFRTSGGRAAKFIKLRKVNNNSAFFVFFECPREQKNRFSNSFLEAERKALSARARVRKKRKGCGGIYIFPLFFVRSACLAGNSF